MVLSPQVCAQLCRRPCYCPWVPPRCPRGSPLVLDGCGCCKVCARRLGDQGLVCDYSTGTGATFAVEDVEEGCEVNGRVYRDGEVFQPSCKLQCRCLDGGFTCVPLCQEDVRLPTPDCPHPAARGHSGSLSPSSVSIQPPRQHPRRCRTCASRGAQEWSACSATCGVGISTRVSNQNRFCRLETQRRLCMARPCPALPVAPPVVSEGLGAARTSGKQP
uniref:Cellular communication network factor 5 n=1 Tax=Anas platyrhynchos TaxID=8839 RepID=A0A8B9T1U6_ANAPL